MQSRMCSGRSLKSSGPLSTLCYRARCELFGLEPLWLRRTPLNYACPFNLCHDNVNSAINGLKMLSVCCTKFVGPLLNRNVSDSAIDQGKIFAVAHSKLWNVLQISLRSWTNLVLFRAQLAELIDVWFLINLTQVTTKLDEAYERGLEFQFMTSSSMRSLSGTLRTQFHLLLPHVLAPSC